MSMLDRLQELRRPASFPGNSRDRHLPADLWLPLLLPGLALLPCPELRKERVRLPALWSSDVWLPALHATAFPHPTGQAGDQPWPPHSQCIPSSPAFTVHSGLLCSQLFCCDDSVNLIPDEPFKGPFTVRVLCPDEKLQNHFSYY